ncbi:hypothetical protein HanPI659440_Chr07g0263481 [Helianthus annuus]|nr:hypothetical protein HanPI659440_Chr07g0263481 [Helianthus annuus]
MGFRNILNSLNLHRLSPFQRLLQSTPYPLSLSLSFSTIQLNSSMFRSLSTRRNHRGYDQLIKDQSSSEPKMQRSTTLPANFFGDYPLKTALEPPKLAKSDPVAKQAKKVSKVHPFFSLFERKSRKKKATAKPEFSRYMQYLKEGGVWDANSDKPVIY